MGNGKGPKARNKLLEITGEFDFESACTGWELEDIVKSEDLETMKLKHNDSEIKDECGLCGQTHLNDNFLLRYLKNGNLLIVGSSCIKRFVKFKDISSQQDSNIYFEKRQKEINDYKSLYELYYKIYDDAVLYQWTNKFRKICADLLKIDVDDFRGLYMSESWFKLLDILNNNFPQKLNEKQENRIKTILFDPKSLRYIVKPVKEKKVNLYSKKARIRTTLSRSRDYLNPSDIFEEAENETQTNS